MGSYWCYSKNTALFLIEIVDIKKNHMNPRIKRPPYPHITLLAPFVPYIERDAAYLALRAELASMNPFLLRIQHLKIFYNNSSYTLYLVDLIDSFV